MHARPCVLHGPATGASTSASVPLSAPAAGRPAALLSRFRTSAHAGRSVTAATHSSPAADDDAAPAVPRRLVLATPPALALLLATALQPGSAAAAARRLKAPPVAEFLTLPDFDWRGATHPGLKYYDLVPGTGKAVTPGTVLTVQYECRYRGIVAVSSRESRLLGGNRTLAEAFTFKYGVLPDEYKRPKKQKKTRVGVGLEIRSPDDPASEPGVFVIADVSSKGPAAAAGVRPLERITAIDGTPAAELTLVEVGKRLGAGDAGSTLTLTLRGPPTSPEGAATRDAVLTRAQVAVKAASGSSGGSFDGPAGGLFSGASGPKPPPALFLAMEGMREGGRRQVLVPSDVGYDDAGINEIPPDADSITLDIELIAVAPGAAA